MVQQKQLLLSELQHFISILEIQSEFINYNNIEELTPETQNRIHSIALFHKKLYVSESVNVV